ncbi:MAG: hypothetical protein ACYC27_16175 [Armatimonadota bacterium]
MGDDHWYHGSPFKLCKLQKGSVVTPFKELAKAFSHKPTKVSMSHGCEVVKHNGTLPGYLYIIADSILPDEILEMPGTDGTHWLIERDMGLELLSELPISDPPQLTNEDIECMLDGREEDFTGYINK